MSQARISSVYSVSLLAAELNSRSVSRRLMPPPTVLPLPPLPSQHTKVAGRRGTHTTQMRDQHQLLGLYTQRLLHLHAGFCYKALHRFFSLPKVLLLCSSACSLQRSSNTWMHIPQWQQVMHQDGLLRCAPPEVGQLGYASLPADGVACETLVPDHLTIPPHPQGSRVG